MPPANPLSVDPTRMAALNRQFNRQFQIRLVQLTRLINEYLRSPKTEDRWKYLSLGEKVSEVRARLKGWVNDLTSRKDPWWEILIAKAYVAGVERAYDDVRKPLLQEEGVRVPLKRDYVLRAIKAPNYTILSVNAPQPPRLPPRDEWGQFMSRKTHELSERLAKGWKREADILSQTIARRVTGGIDKGFSPEKIAKDIQDISPGIPAARAATIARTEVTRAFADGQLDSYSNLGVKMVKGIPEVEIVTAGDAYVCEECYALVGLSMPIEAARGIIPIHPNCRCAWQAVPMNLPSE